MILDTTADGAKLDALKAWLVANGFGAEGTDSDAMAALNALAAPAFYIYDSAVRVDAILDKLNYTNYTPNDPPDQANATAAQVWENRAMLVQLKQINLQLIMQGRGTVDATKSTIRAGIQDATQNLPTGAAGANRSGGWSNIQPILARKATVGEKLFATGANDGSTNVLPKDVGLNAAGDLLQGQINSQNISDARSRT